MRRITRPEATSQRVMMGFPSMVSRPGEHLPVRRECKAVRNPVSLESPDLAAGSRVIEVDPTKYLAPFPWDDLVAHLLGPDGQ